MARDYNLAYDIPGAAKGTKAYLLPLLLEHLAWNPDENFLENRTYFKSGVERAGPPLGDNVSERAAWKKKAKVSPFGTLRKEMNVQTDETLESPKKPAKAMETQTEAPQKKAATPIETQTEESKAVDPIEEDVREFIEGLRALKDTNMSPYYLEKIVGDWEKSKQTVSRATEEYRRDARIEAGSKALGISRGDWVRYDEMREMLKNEAAAKEQEMLEYTGMRIPFNTWDTDEVAKETLATSDRLKRFIKDFPTEEKIQAFLQKSREKEAAYQKKNEEALAEKARLDLKRADMLKSRKVRSQLKWEDISRFNVFALSDLMENRIIEKGVTKAFPWPRTQYRKGKNNELIFKNSQGDLGTRAGTYVGAYNGEEILWANLVMAPGALHVDSSHEVIKPPEYWDLVRGEIWKIPFQNSPTLLKGVPETRDMIDNQFVRPDEYGRRYRRVILNFTRYILDTTNNHVHEYLENSYGLPDDVGNRIGQYCAYDPEEPIKYKDEDGEIERCKETAEQTKQKKALEEEVKKLVEMLKKPGASPPVDIEALIAAANQMKIAEDEKEESKKPGPKVVMGKPVKDMDDTFNINIDGTDYILIKGENQLYTPEYSWVGYYQPGNKKEPIRFTENLDPGT
jgi:hypothetical protein